MKIKVELYCAYRSEEKLPTTTQLQQLQSIVDFWQNMCDIEPSIGKENPSIDFVWEFGFKMTQKLEHLWSFAATVRPFK